MLLKLGSKGENVTYLQYGLHILCYSPKGFDGVFGKDTESAVKKFQTKYGLMSDGVVGDSTWNTLKSEIKTIQNQLNKKGVNVGTADGIAGSNTYKGVIEFQKKNNLGSDGQVGPATWDILFDSVSGGNSYSRLLKLINPLMYGEDIRAVQNKLNSLGYMAGTADGYYGSMTKNAVIKFQQNKKLEADGIVGPSTWNALFSTSTNGNGGYSRVLKVTNPLMYGEDIKAVQNKLNSLGFSAGSADGYYGNGTRDAVVKFQRARGLDADGMVGPSTWNALFGSSANGSGDYSRVLKVTNPLMYGEDIRAVQNKLNSLGFNAGSADGYYGNGTRDAVIRFQRARGLEADGMVGPATWNTLFNSSSGGGSGSVSGGAIGNIRKVFIDPGHGGSDSGAVGNGLREKDIALDISKKLGDILRKNGIQVKFSRTSDVYISLSERAAMANSWGADLFVSVHCNSFSDSSANGTECFSHPTAGTSTKGLSRNVANSIANKLVLTNRGHKEANFAVLRLSNMPAILVETAFISNSSNASKLKSRQYDFASAIASQILGHSNDGTSTGGNTNGGSGYSRVLKVTNPLMYGNDVKTVQNRLNKLGFNAGTADGYYGNDTKNAVIRFQREVNLDDDGMVGPSTWNYLFDQVLDDILKKGSKLGLYSGVSIEFERFNVKTPIKTISLFPPIHVQGELSLTSTIPGPVSSYINISYSPETIASSLIGKLNEAGVEFNFSRKNLELSIAKLTVAQGINDIIKYSISVKPDKTIEITFEAKGEQKSSTTQRIRTFYQRIIITIEPKIVPSISLRSTVPVLSTSDYEASAKFNPLLAMVALAGIIGIVYVGSKVGIVVTVFGKIKDFIVSAFFIKEIFS
ncbi:peptidoglycan-binding protein [Clostridium baratii]|uniref:peptidoglycan-binding protein n=1 Tax=Clostridium baratii TaxID=1561 RepID=UPI0030D42E40